MGRIYCRVAFILATKLANKIVYFLEDLGLEMSLYTLINPRKPFNKQWSHQCCYHGKKLLQKHRDTGAKWTSPGETRLPGAIKPLVDIVDLYCFPLASGVHGKFLSS